MRIESSHPSHSASVIGCPLAPPQHDRNAARRKPLNTNTERIASELDAVADGLQYALDSCTSGETPHFLKEREGD